MKTKILLSLITVIAIFGTNNFSNAEETKTTTPVQGAQPMPSPKVMEVKMDKSKMKAMMKDCMANHKDGKMCESQTMEECQKNMDSKECMKMMKKTMNKN